MSDLPDLLPRGGQPTAQSSPALGIKAAALARQAGVLVRGIRDLIALAPPLIITRAEIDQLFDAVASVLEHLWD